MITFLYAGLLGLMYLALSVWVIKKRVKHKVSIGDNGNNDLLTAVRAHGNFSEFVPIILILMALVESAELSGIIVHTIGLFLIIGRVFHFAGLTSGTGVNMYRQVGMALTFLALLMGSFISILAYFNS